MSKLSDWVKNATDDDLVDVIAGERPAGMPPRRGRMSKHTPGPWLVETETSVIVSGSDSGHGVVASTYPHNRDANATLIAAAPDMLAELKRLRDVVGEADADCIEAVIAKAEGESTE